MLRLKWSWSCLQTQSDYSGMQHSQRVLLEETYVGGWMLWKRKITVPLFKLVRTSGATTKNEMRVVTVTCVFPEGGFSLGKQ